MIEIIPEKPEVTPQLFDSCIATIKDFCCGDCRKCERVGQCSVLFKVRPKYWEIID